jgi:disulfide bond formation protein DsbB
MVRTSPVSYRDGDRARVGLAVATAVATVATSGSLWFSLGLGLVPCTLCWYQRILMYPLVVIVGVAAVERRPGVYRTALPLAVPGLLLAAYHSYLQATTARCTLAGPCAAVQWRAPVIGLTIPNLSFVGFGLLVASLVWVRERTRP